jgi:anaerobic magnesium-protoporphyrin IX monomethyl ester cyclase
MKILFLNPLYVKGFCKTARWFARSRAREQRHPDYICTAMAVLEKAGHECWFIDGSAGNISEEDTIRILKDFRADIAVINATTPSIYSDLACARICKEASGGGIFTIMIGPHVSVEAEGTLKRGAGFLDAIARREYDYTLKEAAGSGNLSDVKGVSYFKNGKITHNPDRPFIEDLDALPFPAWRHIDLRNYYAPAKRNPFITVITGRGCEGRCGFCLFPQVMYGRSYRARSPQNVLDEIEYDIKMFPSLKEIMFEDDTLTLKKYNARLEKICRGMIDRKIKISWSCNARPDTLDISLLRLMRKSGCRMMCVGFESGDDAILGNLKKGISSDTMRKFAGLCRQAGISVHGCFVIGSPGETKETIRNTAEFAASLPVDTVQFSGLCPYPGTEFYSWCRDNDFIRAKDWNEWVDPDGEQKTIVDFPGLSCGYMNKAIDRALYNFYLRPGYIISQLIRTRSIHDIKARARGIFNFISRKRKA